MKSIILAAGQGTRLRPITDTIPKCMVQYQSKCIIDYILETMNACNIQSNILINGYKKEAITEHLKNQPVTFYTNPEFNTSNMVATLFCAEAEMDDDIIISYADIIYKPAVLQALINSPADFACVVDLKWKELWLQRMDNPLEDAETMKLNDDLTIYELGKKAHSYNDIEGQYIGLIKISKNVIKNIKDYYYSLDKNSLFEGKSYSNMYMTSFIQMVIDNLMPVHAVCINGGWLEVDCIEDLSSTMIE
jgi:L-glutamine-phosphate cytidylyltransferase